MELIIRALTPLHVGSGNILQPFDYYKLPDRIMVLNHEACFETIFEKHSEKVDHYVAWVNDTSREIREAEETAKEARRHKKRVPGPNPNQIVADLKKSFNIIEYVENKLKDRELAGILRSDNRFRQYDGYYDGKVRITELREALKTNGNLFIPGSSIKGALRTALAYMVISRLDPNTSRNFLQTRFGENRSIKEMLREIHTASNDTLKALDSNNWKRQKEVFNKLNSLRKRYSKQIGENVERFVFNCTPNNARRDNPQYDMLRLLRVGDTTEAHAQLLFSDVGSFTYNAKFQRMNTQPLSLTEFIDAGSEFRFSMEVDSYLIHLLTDERKRSRWYNFPEKFQRLFGLSLAKAAERAPEKLEERIVKQLLTAVQHFGEALREREWQWLERFKSSETETLKVLFEHTMESGRIYTKLGYASGWLGTTMGLAFENNPHLQKTLPEIIYAFNLDLTWKIAKLLNFPPGRNDKKADRQRSLLTRNIHPQRFPGSRRLMADGRNVMDYIGWIEFSKGDDFTVPVNKSDKVITAAQPEPVEAEASFEKKVEKLKKKFGK